MTELTLSGVADLQNLPGGTVVVLRLIPYGSTGSGGTWYVYDQSSGNDLLVNGSVSGGNAPRGGSGGRSGAQASGADLTGLLLAYGRRVAGGFSSVLPTIPSGAVSARPLRLDEAARSSSAAAAWWRTTRDEGSPGHADDLVWALWGEGEVTWNLWG
jgi:hypothetical protein